MVRVWGPGAVEVVDRSFKPNAGKGLRNSLVGRLRVGRIGEGLGDEVVSVVVEGIDGSLEVEVQCHGGPAAIGLVVAALQEGGVRLSTPRNWARHSGCSRIEAQAEIALAQTPTLKAAAILLDQVNGALDAELSQILQCETEIALARLDALIDRARIGTRLVEGWRVVLAGRPNVGKSRLLNALAGFDRAIVAPEPGTTRDLVSIRSALGGWPVELTDTAGLRLATDPIEAQGVALARDHQRQADLVLVVLDRSQPLNDADHAILVEYPSALRIANKSDLPATWNAATLGALTVSAERGDGVEALVETIASRLVPESPEPGLAVPFHPAHVRRLKLIRTLYLQNEHSRAQRSILKWLGSNRKMPD